MLIVEGPDGVGKTSFCNAVAAELQRIGLTVDSDHMTDVDRGMDVAKYAKRFRPGVVCDRAHMSNLVYGKVCRGKAELSPLQYRIIDGLMLACGGLVVLLCPTMQRYEQILETDDREHYADPAMNRKVAAMFRALATDRLIDGYHPWIDAVYALDLNVPWPAENRALVESVALQYVQLTEAL